jgi:hypothetical protein
MVAPEIQFGKATSHGETYQSLMLNPADLLRQTLTPTIDLQAPLSEFKLFEGVWHSCYPGTAACSLAHPVFNCRGDLLFELRPSSTFAAETGGSTRKTTAWAKKQRGRSRVRQGGKQTNARAQSFSNIFWQSNKILWGMWTT